MQYCGVPLDWHWHLSVFVIAHGATKRFLLYFLFNFRERSKALASSTSRCLLHFPLTSSLTQIPSMAVPLLHFPDRGVFFFPARLQDDGVALKLNQPFLSPSNPIMVILIGNRSNLFITEPFEFLPRLRLHFQTCLG